MSSSTRVLLFVLPVLALVAAFWFLLLAPKREEASELETKVGDLEAQVEQQEQLAATAEAARKDFPRAYRRLVVLGKATPSDDDTSSLLVQLESIAADADVNFVSLQAEQSDAGTEAPAPTEPQTGSQAADTSEQRVDDAEAGTTPPPPAAPTEATAALLPIGAAIGPAGLPVMKYTLNFDGDFFSLADFVAGLDDLVTTRGDGHIGVKGRLITVDGFELEPVGDLGADPELSATFQITTFVTPADEGPTGGATPTGPAPPTAPQTVGAPAATPPPTETASTTAP
jgi:hypothetical protein